MARRRIFTFLFLLLTAVAFVGFVALGVWQVKRLAWKEDLIVFAEPGTEVQVAGFDLRLEGVEEVPGPNYTAFRATLVVSRDGEFLQNLYPERRNYPVARSQSLRAPRSASQPPIRPIARVRGSVHAEWRAGAPGAGS